MPLHQFDKTSEMMFGVVRPRCGFGVILDGEDGQLLVAHAFDAVVVEVDVCDFNFGRETVGCNREAVIVRSDLDRAGGAFKDRLIAAAMTEAQFIGRAAEGTPQELMPEADAER